jgi:hypothetical protein
MHTATRRARLLCALDTIEAALQSLYEDLDALHAAIAYQVHQRREVLGYLAAFPSDKEADDGLEYSRSSVPRPRPTD